MSAFFNLTLDTLAPQGVSILINGGAIYTSNKSVTLTIGTTDVSTAGYSMKIYGSIVGSSTAEEAQWETFATEKTVTITDGERFCLE